MTERGEIRTKFEDLSPKEQAKIIMKERTPSPDEVIYTPTIEFLDPAGDLTREERGKVIAMGDRTAKSYRSLAKVVLTERDKPPVEVEGEMMDATSAFYLQYALGARSSEEIAHTSILEQVNVGPKIYGGDPPIIMEGISVLSALRDVCSLRHLAFEAFSSRGGIFPENYQRIPRQLEEIGVGKELYAINEDIYRVYLYLTEKGLEHYIRATPREQGEKLWKWKWRVLNLSLDDSRQVTNGTFLNHLSMHPNSALSLREALVELSSSWLPETQEIARDLRNLAEAGLPTLMRYTEASPFMSSLEKKKKEIAEELGLVSGKVEREMKSRSKLLDAKVTLNSNRVFVAAFLARNGEISYLEAFDKLRGTSSEQVSAYIQRIFEGMQPYDKPPKELETVHVRADFLMSLGAIYEAIRHRLATHLVGRLTPNNGFTTPSIYVELGIEKEYEKAIRLNERAYSLVKSLGEEYDVFSDYFVARAHLIPFTMRMSAYDIFHFVKLRASKGAHPDISSPANELAFLLQETQNSIFKHLTLRR
ncbi:FAD-dependent thymidylate synthase [Candidatus Woesebacteria bacterium]|nr:FAD-dependent thymidylate synthase [Candidatus Woesebacteria bacterium]